MRKARKPSPTESLWLLELDPEPLEVAQRAFAALPGAVSEYYYRGDSACHESRLINWLRDEKREGGP